MSKKPVVTAYHTKDGTSVESPCSCFGGLMRVHSTERCAFVIYREKHPDDAEFEQIDLYENPAYLSLQRKIARTRRWTIIPSFKLTL